MASAIQKLHDHFLSCIICTDLYKDPCTLSCGHTFCKDCLVKFTKTQHHAVRAQSLLCPNCKQVMKVPNPTKKIEDWVKQIKPSFLIQGLLDDFASRETVDIAPVNNPCITCLQHGDNTPAISYCTDCEMNLCKKCVNTLHSIPATANHVLSEFEGDAKGRKKRRVICRTHGSIVEFCCKDCRKAICQKCCILDHRKCDNVVTIESMVQDMKSVLKENRDMLSQQMERTESSMNTMETRITYIDEKKTQTEAEIKKASETIINLIRRKEKILLKELEDITGKQVGDLRGQLKSGEIDIQMYQQHREFIDQFLTTESEMDMYDMYQMCQSGSITTVSDTDTQLKYTSHIDDITFVEEFDKGTLDKSLKLGKLTIQKKELDPTYLATMMETIDIRTSTDKDSPDPVDVVILDLDGTGTIMIVTDQGKNCLKCFYTMGKRSRHSSLPLSCKPWSVTRLTHNQVAVSYVDHNQISLVKVTPELVLRSHITTHHMYSGLTALTNTTLVVGCHSPPSLDIIDVTGHVHAQRSITTDKKLIRHPYFLTRTNNGNILVSDNLLKSVLCLTPEGDVIFNYTPSGDRALMDPTGITTSTTGDMILVADRSNKRVTQLTSTGQFVRHLLSPQDGIDRPWGICLYKDKLYVVQEEQSLKVFRVST